jgi:hypothetical protein
MKLKMTKPCYDKYTGQLYESGRVYEFEDKRANDFITAKVAEVVEEAKVEEPEKVETKKEDKKSSKKRK